jgi:hypothetical protein
MTEVIEKKKYSAQIKYDKERTANDPEYRQKKKEVSKSINNNRYKTDPEYRERQKANARARSELIKELFKQHRNSEMSVN